MDGMGGKPTSECENPKEARNPKGTNEYDSLYTNFTNRHEWGQDEGHGRMIRMTFCWSFLYGLYKCGRRMRGVE